MNTTIEFLEAVKAKTGAVSDYALANVLRVAQQTVSVNCNNPSPAIWPVFYNREE